ncbi:MAG: hypothetical protein ABR579_07690 [Actinomycetota bacterium]
MKKALAAVGIAVLAATFMFPGRSFASSSSPPTVTWAWYWQEQHSEEIQDPTGNTYNVELPNPLCPGPPGDIGAVQQACARGRLPVEISHGDYDNPDKFSAVNFDLSLIPVGSTVSNFTVSFLEDKAGCAGNDSNGAPTGCNETDPVNIDGKQLQACAISQVFGAGQARPVNEAPKYACTDLDPVATRKTIKPKGNASPPPGQDANDHVWTFDLTPFAQKWVKTFTVTTSIMIVGRPPNNYDPKNMDNSDNWRVVLAGPQVKNGVKATITYTPPASSGTGGTGGSGTGTGTDTGTGTSTGTGSTIGSSGTLGGSSTGTGSSGSGVTGSGGSSTAPSPGSTPLAASAPAPTEPGLPAYVWLAILCGVVGFFLVRSVVVESTGGARSNGVLAQIRNVNEQRRGPTAEPSASSDPALPSRVAAPFKAVGRGISSLTSRFSKKG